MKTQLLMIATGLLTLFGLTSCFQVDNTITVNKDGSGTIVEETIFGEQMQMMLEMAKAQGGAAQANPMDKMMDKTKAEARAKQMGEGVELVGIEKINNGGKLGVRTTYKFTDINKVKYSTAGALDMGDLPGAAAGAAKKADDAGVTFKLADGKLSIIQKAPKAEDAEKVEGDAEPAPAGDIDPQQLAMMQGVMKDMRITMKVKIAPGIAKTDASHVDGDTITLGDIKMDKILANPEKLKALQGGDFDKTKEAMKGVDGVKFEGKEIVEVEMK
ncbi:hypothetical protein NT6N_36490 [Oceaniferula spumae]|uniref:Lipoprotein n=1 Tax=Oceaniferula spumae TaxID=2979115 RepID=A0AAT9FRT4_9BACT